MLLTPDRVTNSRTATLMSQQVRAIAAGLRSYPELIKALKSARDVEPARPPPSSVPIPEEPIAIPERGTDGWRADANFTPQRHSTFACRLGSPDASASSRLNFSKKALGPMDFPVGRSTLSRLDGKQPAPWTDEFSELARVLGPIQARAELVHVCPVATSRSSPPSRNSPRSCNYAWAVVC